MTTIERKILAVFLFLMGIWLFTLTILHALNKINATPLVISLIASIVIVPLTVRLLVKLNRRP